MVAEMRFVGAILVLLPAITDCFVSAPNKQRSPAHQWHQGQIHAAGIQIPETNPFANTTAVSRVSGIQFSKVLEGLDVLYPPSLLEERNAQSRRDAYWPYIYKGKDPPKSLTYGEFDFYFFGELLDMAHDIWKAENPDKNWSDAVFVDLGSGSGRLVVAAAALQPSLKLCRGIELMPGIHETAETILKQIEKEEEDLITSSDDEGAKKSSGQFELAIGTEQRLAMAPVQLICGSFSDPYTYFGDASIIFIFASAFEDLSELSISIARQCHPGTIIITTDNQLCLQGTIPAIPGDDNFSTESPFRFDLLQEHDGYCWVTGGRTTAYLYRLVQSLGIPERI